MEWYECVHEHYFYNYTVTEFQPDRNYKTKEIPGHSHCQQLWHALHQCFMVIYQFGCHLHPDIWLKVSDVNFREEFYNMVKMYVTKFELYLLFTIYKPLFPNSLNVLLNLRLIYEY